MAAKQKLNAAQMKGLRAQYDITNQWMSTDVGQVEILLTELGGTTTVGIQAAAQQCVGSSNSSFWGRFPPPLPFSFADDGASPSFLLPVPFTC